VIRPASIFEDTQTLIVQASTVNTIDVKNRSMSGQARPDSRRSVVLSPVDNLRQHLPVRFVGQLRSPRFTPSHDQAIETPIPQIVYTRIHVGDVTLDGAGPRNSRQRVQPHSDHDSVGSLGKQAQKLTLGRLQRSIRHVIDQADIEAAGFREKTGP
jgi:hypothetical protein